MAKCAFVAEEIPCRVTGLFNKGLFRRLTKERCLAIYLFVRWLYAKRKKVGWLNGALYLKCSAVCLQRYYGRTFDPHLALPFPVSNTRSGIPRCIPSFHRHMSLRRDEKADKLVKFYLSLLSLF